MGIAAKVISIPDDGWNVKTLKEHHEREIALLKEGYEKEISQLKEDFKTQFSLLKDLLTERDLRYSEKFIASEKAVTTAFASSEKASLKAEQAQESYNVRSNEFRGQLDDQAKTLMPRLETDNRFVNIEEKISSSSKTSVDKIEEQIKKLDIISNRIITIESSVASMQTLSVAIDSNRKAVETLSSRVTTIEGTKIGSADRKTDLHSTLVIVIAAIAMIISFVTLIITLKH